jgi:hypothetical protein
MILPIVNQGVATWSMYLVWPLVIWSHVGWFRSERLRYKVDYILTNKSRISGKTSPPETRRFTTETDSHSVRLGIIRALASVS